MTDVAISREVPMDRLVFPAEDVRAGRDDDGVRSLAASMGDPEVGQQQPITVYPAGPDDRPDDTDEDDLVACYEDGADLVIHDGVTRYLAAEQLGWATLWAVIVPEPPENEVVARLEANTERLDMSDYEVFSALKDHYEASDATLEDVGAKIGVGPSYVSKVFSLFESPDWLRDAWQADQHPLDTSHALAVRSLLGEETVDAYASAGGLDPDEAYRRAVDDAQLMIDVQDNHQLPVSDFRTRVKRCRKETLDQLKDQRTLDEKRADGQSAKAETEHSHSLATDPDPEPCLICGQDADRKIAVDVCRSDYGMLSDMKANDDVLMAQADSQPATGPDTPAADGTDSAAAQALADAAGISPEQAQQVVAQVQREAQQAPQDEPDA